MSNEMEATENNDSTNDEIRNYVMAPALPVNPETAQPIERHVCVINHKKNGTGNGDFAVTNNNAVKNSYQDETITIELDEDEQHLFGTIRKASKAWEEGKMNNLSKKFVQVRVAGGWVRDKILGLQTHDVDIALDTCTGVEFANVLKAYVQTFESNDTDNLTKKVGRIGVIAANPAQSKHLETATMKIFDIDVDFSNLRHETYAEDSRIPETVTGTPLEDAYRRDFTMNTLYYNLDTQRIEDWTRRGLQDLLETKIVQTPLEAYQTFHDDPLRVLRSVRFAVRYQMQLSDDLIQACKHPQIHKELHRKVSRERVGKELEGMLSGKHADPLQAMDLICRMKLAGSVFCLPGPEHPLLGTVGLSHLEAVPYQALDDEQLAHLRESAWEEARECIKLLPSVLNPLQIEPNGNSLLLKITENTMTITPVDVRLVYIAVILLPYEHLQYIVKNKIKNVVEFMMREGIKFKNKDVIAMSSLTAGLDDMVQLLKRDPEVTPTTRLQAGLLLRKTRDMWTTTLVVATIALIRKQQSSDVDWYRRAVRWFLTIVEEMDLECCWDVKPLMNGKDLIHYLGLNKGPDVGIYTQEQVQWMLMNPKGTLQELQCFLKNFQKAREFEQDEAAKHISKKMHL